QGEHDVVGPEQERGQERALDLLHSTALLERGNYHSFGRNIRLMLPFIVAEIGTEVLDVELGLRDRVETRDQFLQPSIPENQDRLSVTRGHRAPPSASCPRAKT